ncbi:tRNA lysidine(34) synthetase TilS [Lutibacter sp.]|uniref:tRNA lysidine(34) synthetase TilS n=1 Tax=Lutibacter sp. TaxID=1925666 RepID=UPI001A350227|nr:tRNA lysidine(34) synthetase TilS [Lutibacter sp.]MBI9040160.1 tRNA lysidine(34) synthetase TilS [Lutibacter sp.]
MKSELRNHIDTNLPFLKDKKLLIAISGGIDSVVLTHLLRKLHYSISLAHCNFSLRGKESNKDEEFVKELGEKYNLPTYTIKFNTEEFAKEKGLSTQMAARELRYTWFEKILAENNLDYIITAHHKDDVIETFLINLTRGTGLDGLTGIPEVNGRIVRPMLPFIRQEVLVYATKKKLIWREDGSNSSIKYFRNKIRHKIVPVLKELNPNLLETFYNTLENLKGSQQIIKDCIKNIEKKVISKKNNEIHFNIEILKNLGNPKIYLFELLHNYGFTEWNDIADLLDAQTGKKVLSKTHQLLKNRDVLVLTTINNLSAITPEEIHVTTKEINTPIHLTFETVSIPISSTNMDHKAFETIIFEKENEISLDLDKIQFPLTIRKWEQGDYFYPIGLNGKKKLSKYFKDEKYSLNDKENTWLLCSNNDIVWLIGKRLDDRFKITKKTANVLKIKN